MKTPPKNILLTTRLSTATLIIGTTILTLTLVLLFMSLDVRPAISQEIPVESRDGMPRHAQANVVLADFEDPAPLAPWALSFSSGATGTLSLGTGHSGLGGQLDFEMDGYSQYALATLNLSVPADAYGISFWIKSPPGVKVMVISGPSYDLPRPFQATDSSEWYQHMLKLPGEENLTSIGIRIDTLDYPISGTILFDEITAITEPIVFDIRPDAVPVFSRTVQASTLSSIFGVDFLQRDGPEPALLDQAKEAGFRYIRDDGSAWLRIETSPGVYNFSALDPVVAEHEARGIKTIMQIMGGNYDITGSWNVPPLSQAEISAFGDYAAAVAEHYQGQGMIYDIWSEPRHHLWNPPLTAEQFAAILREAGRRIKEVDPKARVISGGIVEYTPSYVRDVANAGGLEYVDEFGVHSYNIGYPEWLSDNLLMIRTALSETLPAPLPISDTESGYGFSDEQLQARMVARQFLSGWANGLSLVTYYNLRDRAPELYGGLIDYDYAPKPAYTAVKTLSEATQGRVLVGLLEGLPSDYFGLRLDGPEDVLLAIWTKELWSPLTVTVPLSSTAVNYVGEPVPLTPVGDALMLTVHDSSGPIYITCTLCETSFTDKVYLPIVIGNH